jgi:hypothetical protein
MHKRSLTDYVFCVEDKPRSQRSIEYDNDALAVLVEEEPSLTMDDIAEC